MGDTGRRRARPSGAGGSSRNDRPPTPPAPADESDTPPELYQVDIPIAPALLYRVGVNAQRQAIEVGGVYDDKIVAVAVYDRPWLSATDPGPARVLGTIYFSTRSDRVYRIEVDPAAGGTFDALLGELERLTGLVPEPDPGPGFETKPGPLSDA